MSLMPTSIRLSKQTKDALKKAAQDKRWSVAQLIQEILKAWLSHREGKK